MKKIIFMYFIAVAALLGSLPIANAADVDSESSIKMNETWIGVKGIVADPQPAKFTLDYGKGKLTVDMDGWKWYTQGKRNCNI